MLYHPQALQWFTNFTGRYDFGQNSLMFVYNNLGMQEKAILGLVGRPSRSLNLFAEFIVDPKNNSEMQCGFKTRFPEWNVTGTVSTTGKATSVYKRTMEIFEVTVQGTIDLKDEKKPATFGLGLNVGMGGM